MVRNDVNLLVQEYDIYVKLKHVEVSKANAWTSSKSLGVVQSGAEVLYLESQIDKQRFPSAWLTGFSLGWTPVEDNVKQKSNSNVDSSFPQYHFQ